MSKGSMGGMKSKPMMMKRHKMMHHHDEEADEQQSRHVFEHGARAPSGPQPFANILCDTHGMDAGRAIELKPLKKRFHFNTFSPCDFNGCDNRP